MINKKVFVIVFLGLVFLAILAFLGKIFILDRQINAFSGLKVDSIPQADIYLNDKSVGSTPYENAKLTPGEYTLRLSVTKTSGSFFPWETKIKLVPQSLTYVNRFIGETDADSGHQIVWMEKLSSKEAKELAVVSSPDDAVIEVDGLDEGSTSKIITNLSAGEHKVRVSKDGFSDQVIDGQIVPGFRLNISVKLAKAGKELELMEKTSSESAKLASPSATPAFKTPYVQILETGLGFLRVRFAPTVASTETGRVNIGDKFPLINEEAGWTEIKIGSTSGWVSNQYIEKFK